MTQLAAAVNATEELWTVDVLPTAPYATVGSETVAIRAKFPSQTFSLTGQATLTQIRVDRGVGGTTAASHTNGSALTPVYGLGGGAGGGGVTVDNQSDPPAEVTTLIAPGAVIAGDEATLPLQLRQIGPYEVNFDDEGIGDDAVAYGDVIPEGTLILTAWAFVTTPMVSDPASNLHQIYISLGPDTGTMAGYGVVSASETADREPIWSNVFEQAPATWALSGSKRICVVPSGGRSLYVEMYPGEGAFTAGTIEVYALIAVPAA